MSPEMDPLLAALIPHRPPFLWIDRIISYQEGVLLAEKTIPPDLEVFQGHYPENPIMPGVLLCEALFQTGAVLIATMLRDGKEIQTGIPVLSRIGVARFKRPVGPGSTISMQVSFKERVAGSWFLKGVLRVKNKIAVQVDFSCTLTSPSQIS